MINRVVLVGRLTKDPELKYTQGGIAVCRFTLACNRPFKSEGGEQQADFIQCVAWRKQAENISNFLNKGSLAGVDGRIQTGSFEGQDGKRVYTTEVVADSTQFLEPKSSNTNNSNRSESPNSSQQAPQQPNRQGQTNTQSNYQTGQNDYGGQAQVYDVPPNVTDDDLPF
ncbi:single-stranded DNA-binding protein [Sporosarcina sp. P12(2017)]|uniref:single-stranded DNA-binding protein n=1 Tax=unclassified Sporosarcina TaxID=2647733 RepID=UPI000C16D12A|nr:MULTISPECIES: single-stranded DNA-binding protein [unclassified Sporosarcina]PIC59080.1 single-stranded DNA-binding protein [Sporosarcina sp. P10]PIC62401.1 single-stranded DNA-binding protein [Sporosarcina sp. P12(2017)]